MRVIDLPAAVVMLTKVASASGLAIDRSETVSVVTLLSSAVATISSPSLSASRRTRSPLARVAREEEGKHGSALTVKSPHENLRCVAAPEHATPKMFLHFWQTGTGQDRSREADQLEEVWQVLSMICQSMPSRFEECPSERQYLITAIHTVT